MLTNIYLEQLLAQYSESKLKDVTLKTIGSLLNEEESQRCVAAQINKYLCVSVSKIDGCELLSECLPKLSPEVISEFGPSWIRSCLNHSEHDKNKDLYLNTLAKTIEFSQNAADFNRKFVSDYLYITLDACLQKNSDLNVKEASLKCIVSILRYYNSSCNSYKKRLEEYVLSYLNTTSENLVKLSGSVFLYYQQVGGAGNDGCNHINNITISLRKLCVSCHKQLDLLFEDQLEFENFESNDIGAFTIPVPPLHFNNYMKMKYQVQVLKNLLSWLSTSLAKGMIKVLHPHELLSVVQRSLSLHVCLEQYKLTAESCHFSTHLMDIQRRVLKLLGILIRLMGSLLAPFYSLITKILLDLISRSQNCSCYNKDNYSIQECIYDVLSIWLEVGRISFDQNLQDKVVACIIRDAFPVADGVTLKITTNVMGKSPKKRNKILQNKLAAMKMNSDSSSVHMKNFKFRVTFSALKTLSILLNHVYLTIKEPVLNKLNSGLLKTLLSIQNGRETFPYNKKECQLILYEIVCAMYEQDAVSILPPIQTVLNILRNGCRNIDQDIAAVCCRGLNSIEKICQPICSSMHTYEERLDESEIQLESTIDVDDEEQDPENLPNSITNGGHHVEGATRKQNIEVLHNEIIVESNIIPENLEECIEIEDNQTPDENNDIQHCSDGDVIDLISEDLSIEICSQDLSSKSRRNEHNDVNQEEPISKRVRFEEHGDEDMFNCLVDEVHDEYD